MALALGKDELLRVLRQLEQRVLLELRRMTKILNNSDNNNKKNKNFAAVSTRALDIPGINFIPVFTVPFI